MTISSKRAEYLSITSLVLGVVFFFITLLLGRWSGYSAVSAISWLILSATLIWFVLLIQFHQRTLAEQEKLDMGQLEKDKEASTIFEAKPERAVLLSVAQNRLRVLEKWFIPVFSVLIAVYQIGIGVLLLYSLKASAEAEIQTKQPLLCAVYMAAIAFVSFLMSRYATGMSSEPGWKPLRAGGSSLLAAAIFCFLLAVSLALTQFKFPLLMSIIKYIIPILLICIGTETALNSIFDIYRPRFKDQYSRAAFDSRLLGIINEPGEILHTAAGAIDYQFGFKVSQTWFYKLLEKAIVPLILFAVFILYLISCIVVVNPDERAIIERFGNPMAGTGQVRFVKPGFALKLPWPIDIAYKYPTEKVRELYIGYEPKMDPKTNLPVREDELLWGKEHYEKEHSVLVASWQTGEQLPEEAVPVSLVKANVPVHYKVKDLYSFLYNHDEPAKLLEAICYRELAKLAASAKIEVNTQQDIENNLLGAGRTKAKRILTDGIQASADKEGLGIEITFVGLQGVHPPLEVASDYQKVIGAVQQKQALILNARTERNSILSTLAGSVDAANELYNLAAEYQQANKEKLPGRDETAQRLDKAFTQASGDIFETLRQAKSYAFEKATLTEAASRRFGSQLKAYRAAKDIYKRLLRLKVFEETLDGVRKYVVVADEKDTQVFIVDVKEKLTPSLYDISGLEEPERP